MGVGADYNIPGPGKMLSYQLMAYPVTAFENQAPGFPGKPGANHEIAVTVHEKYRCAGISTSPDSGFYRLVGRFRVVISDPCFEQVAQYIQGFGLAPPRCQEIQKAPDDGGAGRMQMKVRDE